MAMNTNSVAILAAITTRALAGSLQVWELELLYQGQNNNRGDMNNALGKMMERAGDLSVALGHRDPQVAVAWEKVGLQRALLDAEDERLEGVAERQAFEAMARNEDLAIHRDWLRTALGSAMTEASEKALEELPSTFGCDAPRIWRTARVVRVMGGQLVANVVYCHHGSSHGGDDMVAFPGSHLGGGKYLAVVKNDWRWEVLTWTWDLKLPSREEVLARPIPAAWKDGADV